MNISLRGLRRLRRELWPDRFDRGRRLLVEDESLVEDGERRRHLLRANMNPTHLSLPHLLRRLRTRNRIGKSSLVSAENRRENNEVVVERANPKGKSSKAGGAGRCYWDDLSTTSSEASYLERRRLRRAERDGRKRGGGGALATWPASASVLRNCVGRVGTKDRPDAAKAGGGNTSDGLPSVRGRSTNPMQMMRKRLRRDKTNVVSRSVRII